MSDALPGAEAGRCLGMCGSGLARADSHVSGHGDARHMKDDDRHFCAVSNEQRTTNNEQQQPVTARVNWGLFLTEFESVLLRSVFAPTRKKRRRLFV